MVNVNECFSENGDSVGDSVARKALLVDHGAARK